MIDLLGGAPTTPSGAANPAPPDGPARPAGRGPHSTPKLALTGAGLAAIVIVGAVWSTSVSGGAEPANTAAAATTTASDEDTVPILDLPEATATTTAASADIDDECLADRGDQNSGAGVIAAWNHAYYAQRNAVAAPSPGHAEQHHRPGRPAPTVHRRGPAGHQLLRCHHRALRGRVQRRSDRTAS